MTKLTGLNRFLTDNYDNIAKNIINNIKACKKVDQMLTAVFPTIKDVEMTFHSINNAEKAKAFLKHEKLGTNLRKACRELLAVKTNNINKFFDKEGAKRVKACMKLFYITTELPLFKEVLDRYFFGKYDGRTIRIIRGMEKEDKKIKKQIEILTRRLKEYAKDL